MRFSDIGDILKGNYLSVSEVAESYETTEDEARSRLKNLESKGVLREAGYGYFVVSDEVDSPRVLLREARKEFSDLRENYPTSFHESVKEM